jgi:allantoin racemase
MAHPGKAQCRRILLINPNTSAATTAMMLSVARPLLPPGWTIEGRQAERGPAMILDEAGLSLAAGEVTAIGFAASPYDAIIVAAFGDPGVAALRDRLPMPVIGIGEAAMREAAGIGRFGIATTTPALVGAMRAMAAQHGLAGHCTGIRVPDEDPLELAGNPQRQDDALLTAAARCIGDDGAAVVIIGGGPLSGSAARLRQHTAVPVIEPVPAAIRAVLAARGA